MDLLLSTTLSEFLNSPTLAGAGGAAVTALAAALHRRIERGRTAARELNDRTAAERGIAFTNLLQLVSVLREQNTSYQAEADQEREARREADELVRTLQSQVQGLELLAKRHNLPGEEINFAMGRGAGL